MTGQIKLRRGLSTEWSSVNPILSQGEPGFATDTNELRLGDGINPWNLLPSFSSYAVSDFSYTHIQAVASTTWTINHNLGFYPTVTVFDSTDRSIITEIQHIDVNTAMVHNDAAFSGKAYCS